MAGAHVAGANVAGAMPDGLVLAWRRIVNKGEHTAIPPRKVRVLLHHTTPLELERVVPSLAAGHVALYVVSIISQRAG